MLANTALVLAVTMEGSAFAFMILLSLGLL